MASNTLASIAAATAAGWKLRRLTEQSRFTTQLSLELAGLPGVRGSEMVLVGESASTSAAADTAALANVNQWRTQRYGADSTSVGTSPIADNATGPSTQGIAPTHRALTKDKS